MRHARTIAGQLLVVWLVLVAPTATHAQAIPQLTAPVNDFANVIDDGSEREIDRQIRAVVRDIDGDGKAEVVTSPAGGVASWMRVLTVTDADVEALEALWPFGSSSTLRGVYVG